MSKRVWVLLGFCWGLCGSLQSQTPRTTKLRPPTATLGTPITSITSIRELSDRRVLLTDPLEKRAAVVDFSGGTVRDIGRRGSGPGEYTYPAPILPIGGDSSLMVDSFGRRWILLFQEEFLGNVPPAGVVIPAGSEPIGTDRYGNIGSIEPIRRGAIRVETDSSYVVLNSRGSGRRDTVARLRPPDPWLDGPRPPYAHYERAILAYDGWLAVVRVKPYRVDWRSPAGRWTLGRPIPYQHVPVDDRVKRSYMQGLAGQGKASPPDSLPSWPTEIPPFTVAYPLFATQDGKVLVARASATELEGLLFDAVAHSGVSEQLIQLDPRERIFGTGVGAIYVGTKDDDGFFHLRRHPWP